MRQGSASGRLALGLPRDCPLGSAPPGLRGTQTAGRSSLWDTWVCGLNDSPQYLPQGMSQSLGRSSEPTALGYKVLATSPPSTTSLCFTPLITVMMSYLSGIL